MDESGRRRTDSSGSRSGAVGTRLEEPSPGPDQVTVPEAPYLRDSQEAVSALRVDPAVGLSRAEAAARLATFGPNELRGKPPTPLWQRVLLQLKDPLVILLILAALISGGAWILEGAHGAPIEAIVVLLVVAFNVGIGLVQESRAADAVAALAEMTAAHVTVLREGELWDIPAAELVPGDILQLSEGDEVGADARLLSSNSLRIAEASLTGESTAVDKSTETLSGRMALGDRSNMAYKGTAVTGGTGRGVVVATGMGTEMGSIATMLDETEEEESPLQSEINHVGGMLGKVVIAIAIVIMLTIAIVQTPQTPGDWVTILLLGVSLAVAAVPEGLPAVLSVVLALGVQRMAKRNAVVKKLSSAETLGSASVICTDKTGTLTQNEMTIKKVVTASGTTELTGAGYEPRGDAVVAELNGDTTSEEAGAGKLSGSDETTAEAAALDETRAVLGLGSLANNAQLAQRDGRWEISGDPTEAAFLSASHKLDGLPDRIDGLERRGEVPFSSDRKMMSTLHSDASGGLTVISKGAPDVLLDKCSQVLVGREAVPLTQSERERILADVERLSSEAYRTLGVASRAVLADDRDELLGGGAFDDSDERDLVFAGVVGIIDPPRSEARDAIEEAHRAGVRVVMITGDHPETARRIATDLTITDADSVVLSGHDIDELNDDELRRAARTTSVYARVAPEHKLRIVDALQADDQIVAMTGDGVNDAPALKSADIGIAMGITGTEVTKEAAKMVLADDNFATIIRAVREGRVIFENIKKFLRYLLCSNMGEVLTMFFGVVLMGVIGLTAAAQDAGMHIVVPLLATQILWINLVTDVAPALAVGVDPELEDVMKRPPRSATERVIDGRMWIAIMSTGFVMAISSLATMDMWLPGGLLHVASEPIEVAQTATFTTLVFGNLFSVFNARSATQSAFHGMFSNRLLLGAVALGAILQIAVVHVPFLQAAFGTTSLDLTHWLVSLGMASLVLWVEEIRKMFLRRKDG
ncbi:cation-translocating P-type ATPase [Actinomycetaceae bacterium L2_0104]